MEEKRNKNKNNVNWVLSAKVEYTEMRILWKLRLMKFERERERERGKDL